MSNLNRVAISAITVGLVSLAALTGCSNSPKTASEPASEPASQPSMATSSGTGTDSLLKVVNNTKAAVEAKDFPQAKTAFEQFEGSWKPIEDGIKTKSPDGYDKIEGSMDQVMSALNASDQQKSLVALQSLSEQINSVK